MLRTDRQTDGAGFRTRCTSHNKKGSNTVEGNDGERETEFFIVLHWDGKIIQLMTGDTEDRLAIVMSSPGKIQGQFLASPVISDGTGRALANTVYRVVSQFELLDDVQAFVFDTTASNTGCWRGSVTMFEAMLGRSALWLARRNHIPELHIKCK